MALQSNHTAARFEDETLSNYAHNEAKMSSEITEDGSVDRKGRPAVKAKTGRWTSAVILLVNYGLATLAFFGVGVNLVLYLTRVLEQDNAEAANNVSKWTGTVYIFSLIGAFLSDSYWGRYMTCAVFQVIYVVGLVILSLTSWFMLINPSGCGDGKLKCNPPSALGSGMFYLSIYLIAFGNGGYQPIIATFGADQFDEKDDKEKMSKIAFFSYFYMALNVGSLFSNTVLVYFEDIGKWEVGFWASAASAFSALLLFLAGTPNYRHFKPSGNPLTRIAQVFVAAIRNWKVESPRDAEMLHEVEGKGSIIGGTRKIPHTDEFRFLDKAATLTYKDVDGREESNGPNPWRLCTVTQVEEVKCVLKMLPVWVCTIVYSIVFTQMASFFVEQGDTMDTNLAGFHLPPASMSVFDLISVIIFIFIYRQVLMPVVIRLSKNPKGLSELQRMGVGLVIAMLAMVAAGVVEVVRLKRVGAHHEPSSLSVLWQIPQYALIGASEVFMYVGQLEFFNGQAPEGIKSFGSSLCMASISLGNYVSILLVNVITRVTTQDNNPGWIPENLNAGHLDRFYFLLAALTVVDFVAYLACAKWYKYVKRQDNEEDEMVDMA